MTVIINGRSGITNVNGSASAPAETGVDTDTGIYYGTNTVGLATNGTSALFVDASQNVGIGTTSPGQKLAVIGTSGTLANSAIRVNSSTGTVSANSGLWLSGNQSTTHYNWLLASQYNVNGAFEITPSTAVDGATFTTPVAVFTQAGNVGIGVTSPYSLAKQDIQIASLSTNWALNIRSLNSGTGDGTTTSRVYRAVNADNNNWANGQYDAWAHIWTKAGTETMRIDSSGNLGLGVTPSAWGNGKAIQVAGSSAAAALYQNSSGSLYLGNNYAFTSGDTYVANGYATRYGQYSGQHAWFTAPSGTAGNPITFTQAMTLDASGNLGVGTSSPTQKLEVAGNILISTSGNPYMEIKTSGAGNNPYLRLTASSTYWDISGIFSDSTDPLQFSYGGSEKMRIDSSGNLLVNATAQTYGEKLKVVNTDSAGNAAFLWHNSTADRDVVIVRNERASGATSAGQINFKCSGGTTVGSISSTGSATSYTTSSDYRLKHDIQPMTGALAKVAALKPVTYKWKADGSDGQGFIAHELAEVVPDCVSGAKDAVDADGNPQYQGVDTSFLVATLTAAIQEQQALIQTLTDRITALETK